MTTIAIIENVSVPDDEIAAIVESMTKATARFKTNSVILASLANAIIMCYPQISKTKLAEGVQTMSEKLALWIEADDETPSIVH